MKKELLKICKVAGVSGEYDDTEFAGRYFVDDLTLDRFARKHGLTQLISKNEFDHDKIEKACDCKIIYDYAGANPNRQFGDQEIIFEEKELYIVSAGLWDINPTPRRTRDDYNDYIRASLTECLDGTFKELFEHDDSRLEYDKLKEIADKNHDWQNMLYEHEDWISGSVYLTKKQAEELEDDFYLESMPELFEKVKTELAEED